MKKKLIAIAALSAVIVGFNVQTSFAATTASQTVTATLPVIKSVTGKNIGLAANIDGDTGALSSTLTPSFTIRTNTTSSQTLYLTALAPYSGGTEQALATSNGLTIALANTDPLNLPTQAAIQNVTGGSPVQANNSNVIGYNFIPQASTTGLALGTWDGTNKRFPYTLTKRGTTSLDNTISTTAIANTYSTDYDNAGDYKATVTLSFAS